MGYQLGEDMDRRKDRDVIWHALHCAINDRVALADAYGNTGKTAEDAMRDAEAFRRLKKKFFGNSKSLLEAELDRMKKVDVHELFKD